MKVVVQYRASAESPRTAVFTGVDVDIAELSASLNKARVASEMVPIGGVAAIRADLVHIITVEADDE